MLDKICIFLSNLSSIFMVIILYYLIFVIVI
jgi:hypothetical protein